jgi:hypothetical protein
MKKIVFFTTCLVIFLTMSSFVDNCLEEYDQSIEEAYVGFDSNSYDCDDAFWLFRSRCRREATMQLDQSIQDAMDSYLDCID